MSRSSCAPRAEDIEKLWARAVDKEDVHKFELELCVGCSMRLVILISDPGIVSRGCLIDLPSRLTFHFSSLAFTALYFTI